MASKIFVPGLNCILSLADTVIALNSSELPRGNCRSALRTSVYVKKTGGTDDVISRDKTEYSSHALAEVVNGIKRNE